MQQAALTKLIDALTGFFLICLSLVLCLIITSADITKAFGFELLPIALLISGLAGIVLLANSFFKDLKILDIFAASTLMGYGLGAFNTYTSAYQYWTDYQLEHSVQDMTFAAIFLNLYCLVLVILARMSTLDSQLLNKVSQVFWSAQSSTYRRFHQTSLVLSGIQAALILSGRAVVTADFSGFSAFSSFSTTTEGGFEKGYLTVLYALIAAISIVSGMLVGLVNQKKIKLDWTIYFILLTNVVWLFISGRRSMLYGLLMILLGYCLATPIKERIALLQSFSLQKIISVILIIAVLAVGWDFFAFMRSYNRSLPTTAEAQGLVNNLSNGFSSYVDLVTNPKNSESRERFKENVSENVSTRTFLFDFLTQSFHLVETQRTLGGQDLTSNIWTALPSNFFIDKSELLRTEKLYNKVYKLDLTDVSDSMLTSALLDFSWLGVLLYPLFLYTVYTLAISISLQTNSVWLYLTLLASLLQPAFSASEGPLLMVLIFLRNYFVLVGLFYASKLFRAWKPLNA